MIPNIGIVIYSAKPGWLAGELAACCNDNGPRRSSGGARPATIVRLHSGGAHWRPLALRIWPLSCAGGQPLLVGSGGGWTASSTAAQRDNGYKQTDKRQNDKFLLPQRRRRVCKLAQRVGRGGQRARGPARLAGQKFRWPRIRRPARPVPSAHHCARRPPLGANLRPSTWCTLAAAWPR